MNRCNGVAMWGLAALLLGCSMGDGERCTEGFVYDPALRACAAIPDADLPEPDAATPAGGPSDAAVVPDDAIAASEAGGAGLEAAAAAPEASVPSGAAFGTTCSAAAECVSAAASYCFKMPGSTVGYCSKLNCTADCPSDYRCCNCPAFSVVVCMKSADAVKASAVGCTCS